MYFKEAPKSSFDAAKQAGLAWDVKMEPVFVQGSTRDELYQVEGKFAIVRQDNREVLSVMGNRYSPIQNLDALKIIDDLTGLSNGLICNAGEFLGGKRVFMQTKLPETFEVIPGDVMEQHLTVVTSHDGSLPLSVMFTGIRLVCNNQMNAMMRSANHKYTLKHTKNANVTHAAQIIEMSVSAFSDLKRICSQLKNKSITTAQRDDFAYRLFPKNEHGKGDSRLKRRDELYRIMEEGQGANIPGVRDSAWGLFNAATELYDHHQKSSSYERSIFFGNIAQKEFAREALAV